MLIKFRGMCSFIKREAEGRYEVYLPTGLVHAEPMCGGHHSHVKHAALLSVPVLDTVVTDGANAWLPDFVVHYNDIQIGCWSLDGKQVTLDAGVSGLPPWNDRAASIDFHDYYDINAKSRAELVALGYPVIDLAGGQISCGPQEAMKVTQKDKSQNSVASYIQWQAQGVTALAVRAAGRTLTIKQPTTICITNSASTPPTEALSHFEHYYTVLSKEVACEDRIHLSFSGVDVYDCVPPIPGS
jgi:hypothetical protein